MGLGQIDGVSLDPEQIRTNIVYFRITRTDLSAEQFAEALGSRGVRLLAAGPGLCRAVTHYQISSEEIAVALRTVKEVMA